MTGFVRLFFTALFVAFSYFSCSSVEPTAVCSGVCVRYGGCFDDELDAADCTEACADDASDNPAFAADVRRCEQCMDLEGCGLSAADCFDECGKVMGQSPL